MGIIDKISGFYYITKEKIKAAYVKITGVMARFFQNALSMMRTVLDKLATRVRGVILGCAHFFRRLGNKYQEGIKNYTVDEELGEWNETTVTRDIGLEDIPPKYRTLDDEFEIDDTAELDAALCY